jgi:hypothetical protein
MILNTIDQIVRRGLLEDSLPIHFYAQFLVNSATCVRELSFDSLQIINTVIIPIDSTGAGELPMDFVDDVAVSNSIGGTLTPIPHKSNINPLRLKDNNGNFIPYPNRNIQINDTNFDFYFGVFGFSWYFNFNDYMEPTGRFFGANGGTERGYSIIRERRQIQVAGMGSCQSIILMYISDGQNIDNATQIDPQCFQTIRAFQEWKFSPNMNNEMSPEGRYYHNQRRLFRARKDDLTPVDIKNIFRLNYSATIKN